MSGSCFGWGAVGWLPMNGLRLVVILSLLILLRAGCVTLVPFAAPPMILALGLGACLWAKMPAATLVAI
jgi:hypothetical protein